jgi:hypothetical protein
LILFFLNINENIGIIIAKNKLIIKLNLRNNNEQLKALIAFLKSDLVFFLFALKIYSKKF